MGGPCYRHKGVGLEREHGGGGGERPVSQEETRKGSRRRGSSRWSGVVSALVLSAAASRAPLAAESAAAGASHSCVVLAGGTVKCWGENFHGQLGQYDNLVRGLNASDMGDNLPTVPLGGFSAAMVEAGSEFSCALAGNSDVKCWGRNEHGQLGLGDNVTRFGPDDTAALGTNLSAVNVGTGETVAQISLAGAQACAVLKSGQVKCWGNNEAGQLGQGDTEDRGDGPNEMGDNLPFVDLGLDVVATSVAVGNKHACAIIDDGDVKCWGNNDGGQLGYEDTDARGILANQMGDNLPTVDLGREQKAITIAAGFFHTCALLFTGDMKCWGFGSSGQLGQGSVLSIGDTNGTMGDNLPAIDLGTGRTGIAISLGGTHTCAVLDNNSLKCWGGNAEGSLGLGDVINRGVAPDEMGDNLTPVALTFGAGSGAVSNVFAGRFHTCVSGTEGGLACFGLNAGGQLGAGTTETPIGDDADEVEAISSIALGSGASVLVLEAPGEGVELVTISPTPSPTPQPTLSPASSLTRSPIEKGPPTLSPAAMASPSVVGDQDSSGSGAGTTAIIVTAAVVAPLAAIFTLVCCLLRRRRRQQKTGEFKGRSSSVSDAQCGVSQGFGREDSFTSSENNVETNGEGSEEALSVKPLVKNHALQSTAPMAGASEVQASSNETKDKSLAESLPRPTAAAAMAAGAAIASGVAATAAAGSAAAPVQSSDDESSRGDPSIPEIPPAHRRTGSNSSISTLGSTSTASSTWPPNDGFVTPARTEIARGGGGRYGRGKGSGGGVEGLPVGFKTPANLAAATPGKGISIPDTPSPRSVSSSVHGTPAPPAMRLAQFARAAGAGDTNLYGLPEMEIGRSTSNVFESNNPPGSGGGSSWPVANSKTSALHTSASAAAAAAAGSGTAASTAAGSGAGGGGPGGGDKTAHPSPHNSSSPAAGSTSASSTGIRAPGGGPGELVPARRKSNRSTGTTGNSPATGGAGDGPWPDREGGGPVAGGKGASGAEAAAQAFAEAAELEALQIDKNDLKLVFGRPFARGKSSEVYQVTHAGKNRAAKIIDLFSLGVVGEEVTRLYASFAQELRAMKGIRHECVAVVYGAVATPSELTIVTDLVKRGPLRTLLTDKKKRESLTSVIRHKIIKDVATGMAYLSEKGIQHRNLHSHNVLITKEWGAKVADYGLAGTSEVMAGAHDRAQRASSTGRERPTSLMAGTLRWMAPELLQPPSKGVDPFTEASDVYSMGIIAWEVLCGGSTLPYDGLPDDKVKSMILEGSTPPVAMETPIVYNKLMLLCWRKSPSSRPKFSHIATVLLKDPPPANKASPR